jgi:MFS family permease
MVPTGSEVLSDRPKPLWPATRRTGGEAPWLWVTYLLGALAIVVVTVLMADELARGAGARTAASGQWFYVTLAVVLVLAVAGQTLLSWRRLPALAGPVPVTVQVLVGLVLTEATAVLTFGLTEAVSAVRYSQLPPPVDTSFMGYAIVALVIVSGLGVIGLLVTLALLRGSRAALVCTTVLQVLAAVVAIMMLIGMYLPPHPHPVAGPWFAAVLLLVPAVLAVLPSTWAWAPRKPRPPPRPRRATYA